MDWSKETVLYFLSLIRERPVIWDTLTRDYRDKEKKNNAVEEIALLMGCSVKTVYTKWTSLKNQYSRERRNMTGLRTGSGADAIYKIKWYAFKEMESLMDGNMPQQTYNNFSESSTSTPTPPPPSTPTPPLRPPSTPTPPLLRPPSTPTPPLLRPPSTPTPPATTQKKNIYKNTVFKEAMETLKSIRQKNESTNKISHNTDDLTSFGLYIAAYLRKLNPRLQCKARYEINKILYTIDMENLDENSSDSSVGREYQYASDYNEHDYSSVQPVQQYAPVPNINQTSPKDINQRNYNETMQQPAQKVVILSSEEFRRIKSPEEVFTYEDTENVNEDSLKLTSEDCINDKCESAVSQFLKFNKKSY